MKRLILVVAMLISLLAGVELFLRMGLGLGDSPLSQADSKIEYLWSPSQTCHPFHHLVHINAYSMRSDEFPNKKADPEELRVMVIGDSVVYDGSQIDQRDISTEVLKRDLQDGMKRKVVVGNIAAKSWGPPNELAYIRRFGLFDADWVVLVLSSHDYADVPTFLPTVDVDPNYPGHKPLLAISEAITRYLPRYLPESLRPYHNPDENMNPTKKDIEWSLSSEREIIKFAKQSGAKVILAQMVEKNETGGHEKIGHKLILEAAQAEKTEILEIGEAFQNSLRAGQDPYLDNIHPNVLGCKIMGDSMAKAIESGAQANPVSKTSY